MQLGEKYLTFSCFLSLVLGVYLLVDLRSARAGNSFDEGSVFCPPITSTSNYDRDNVECRVDKTSALVPDDCNAYIGQVIDDVTNLLTGPKFTRKLLRNVGQRTGLHDIRILTDDNPRLHDIEGLAWGSLRDESAGKPAVKDILIYQASLSFDADANQINATLIERYYKNPPIDCQKIPDDQNLASVLMQAIHAEIPALCKQARLNAW